MIARIWHGWTKPENAKAYEDMLREEIFPSIAARNIKGYRGAELFINQNADEVGVRDVVEILFNGCGERICRRGHRASR